MKTKPPKIDRGKQDLSEFSALVTKYGMPEVLRSLANLCERRAIIHKNRASAFYDASADLELAASRFEA